MAGDPEVAGGVDDDAIEYRSGAVAEEEGAVGVAIGGAVELAVGGLGTSPQWVMRWPSESNLVMRESPMSAT